MKKIIATVLAMVMALALCTTAFAADTTYTAKYTKTGEETKGSFVVSDVVARKADATQSAAVKGYQYDNKYYVAADASDFDLKLTAETKATLYLKEAPNNALGYLAKAKVFTNIGEDCMQLDVADLTNTYYISTDEDGVNTYYAKGGTDNILVDGKLVAVTVLGGDSNLVEHSWKVDTLNKDNTVATYKCKECGTVATVYKTKDAAEAAGCKVVEIYKGEVLGYGAATTPSTDKNTSPKTFDAGIAMYVGMALTSVAGSAVVIGKKKEF